MKTPFDSQKLIATKNMLRVTKASEQVVSCNNSNVLWDGSTVFGFSIVFQANTTPDLLDIISRRNSIINDGSGYGLRATASGEGFHLKFFVETTIPNSFEYGLGYFEINRLYRINIFIEPFDGVSVYINYKINNGPLIRDVFCNTSIPISTSQPLLIGGTIDYPGYNLCLDGFVSNVIFFNSIPSDSELSALHEVNIPIYSLHNKITAYYPLNQKIGPKAWDVVEQYNYSKTTALNAAHGDLINYTNEEVGLVDPLLQTAWCNLYLKSTNTEVLERVNALRFNGTNQYITVADFNPTKEKGYTIITGWCLNSNRQFNLFRDVVYGKRNTYSTKVKVHGGNPGVNKEMYFFHYSAGQDFIGDSTIYLNTNLSKPMMFALQERDHLELGEPHYDGYINGKFFVNGHKVSSFTNSSNRIVGFDEITGDFYIGSDNITVASAIDCYFNGYIFFVGVWKGWLSEADILNITNNTLPLSIASHLMDDCQLYLNFDSIIDDSGTYKIKDWSPQNREVILNGYTADDVNPAHADYKLFDLDTLR